MDLLPLQVRTFLRIAAAFAFVVCTATLSAALNSQEQAVADRVINDAGQRRPFVVVDATLSAVARARAEDMARRRYFSHTNPDGYAANYLIRQAGYPLPGYYDTSNAGNNVESIAAGYSSASAVWSGWMNSPSHRTHILAENPFYQAQTSLGVGYFEDPSAPYRYYWVILTAPPRPPTAPTLAVSAPAAGARLASSQVTVSGTTGGLATTASIRVRVENAAGIGGWVTAGGVTSWSAGVSGLVPGVNTLRIQSLNASGTVLLEVVRTVTYVVLTPLVVTVEGPGTVNAGFAGSTNREIGARFTLTARPDAGSLFAGWSGGVNANTPSVTFTMSQGLQLTVRFIPNPFIARAGSFGGNVLGGTFTHATAGGVKLSMTTLGAFSGRITLGGAVYPVVGKFDLDGNATVAIPRRGLPTLTVSLHIDLAGAPGVITGNVGDGTFTSNFSAARNRLAAAGPSPYLGRYTVLLPRDPGITSPDVPSGAGFGVLTVNTAGAASLAGTLADGVALSAAGSVDDDGEFPVFMMLDRGKGSIVGTLKIAGDEAGAISGRYYWSRPERPAAVMFKNAFSVQNPFVGSRYVAPKAGVRLLATADAANNVTFTFAEGNLPGTVAQPGTLLSTNRITFPAPILPRPAVVAYPANGRLEGSFIHPVTRATSRFRGVVLQAQNLGGGYFLGKDTGGPMILAGSSAAR